MEGVAEPASGTSHVPNGRENPQFCQCWKILVSGSVLRSPTLARTILPHSQNWRTHSDSNHRIHNWLRFSLKLPRPDGDEVFLFADNCAETSFLGDRLLPSPSLPKARLALDKKKSLPRGCADRVNNVSSVSTRSKAAPLSLSYCENQ